MAKFCANCGAPLGEDDKVCGQCGTPVDGAEQAAPAETPVFETASPVAKPAKSGGNMGKLIAIIAAAVVIIAAIVVLLVVIKPFGGGSPKGTVEKLFSAIKDEDPEAIVKLLSGLDTNQDSYDEDDAIELFESMIDSYLDTLEDKVDGEDIKSITVEIADKDIKEMSERKFKKFKEELEDEGNYEDSFISSIKSVVKVKAKLSIKGDDGSSGKYTVDELILVKEKGGWKLLMDTSLVRSYF